MENCISLLHAVGVPVVLWLKVGDVARQAERFNGHFNSSATDFVSNSSQLIRNATVMMSTKAELFLEVHSKIQADFAEVQDDFAKVLTVRADI